MKISRGVMVASARQLAELPELKQADFLEVPALMADTPDLTVPAAWKGRLRRAECRGEARVLTSVIDAGRGVKQDFFRAFGARCEALCRFGVREITVGTDWETIFSDAAYAGKLREILHCCFGIAERYSMTVFLEVRTPGNAAARPAEYRKFRDALLLPVRTLIDLHPHEPGALEMLDSFAGAMPFDCGFFRVSFDASGGNYLSGRLLEKITAMLRPVGRELPSLCFYPGRGADREAFRMLEAVMQ